MASAVALSAGCSSHGSTGGLVPATTSASSTANPKSISAIRAAAVAGESAYPSGTPWPIPGQIDFDNFDLGGQGVAYHTTLSSNPSGKYRPTEQVGIEGDTDTSNGNGYDIGWNNNGNFYKYTVNVAAAATYPIAFRIAANSAGSFHIEDELGNNLTGEIQVAATGGFQAWATLNSSMTLTAGQHILKVVIDSGNGSFNLNEMTIGTIATPPPALEQAYPGGKPWPIPGQIDFDNFDIGGQGVAYRTTLSSNPSGKYRPTEQVGIEGDTDTGNGNGYDIGWNSNGNFYKYTVNVTAAATYSVAFRIAANSAGSFHIEDETGKNVTGEIQVAATGGFQAWATLNGSMTLTAGQHVLKVVIDSGNGSFNLNDMTIGTVAATPTPPPAQEQAYPSGTPWPIPGQIDFDNFDIGGQGVAYHTTLSNNPGGKYRLTEQVGIEGDTDTGNGNGYDIGWNNNGNFYKYTVNVTAAATYPVTFRIAANSAGSFHIEDETGKNITGEIQVAATGGFQAWATLNGSITLAAGQHVLKVAIDSGNGSFNLNDMTIGTATATPTPQPTTTPTSSPTTGPTSNPSDIDWPTQGFDTSRDGYNPNETRLTASTISGLKLQWSQRIAGDSTSKYANSQPVVAAGVSVNGVPTDIVLTGDEHGFFSAFNASTGALLWRKSLGSEVTGCADIPDKTFGITDSAAIDHAHNRVYVVDGAGLLWAFDLATGNVASGWPAGGISVVNDPAIDHVWSGLTFNPSNSTLYVPTASYCDLNRWQGALRAVNTQSASVTGIYYFATGTSTPPGATGPYGGGVWSWGGIALDPTTQNLYAASGNTNPEVPSPASNESITEWSPTLGLVANFFPTIGNGDLDFGGTAVLYNAGGSQCLAAYRKSGQLFSFDRTNVNAGPKTTWQIGQSGISSPAFSAATGLLYFNNPNLGTLAQGLYAIQTGAGCVLNQTPVWSVTNVRASLQPITVAGGVVYDIFGSQITALNAATGTQLWTSGSSIVSGVQSGATVVNGHIYVVDWNDTLYSFGLPTASTALKSRIH